MSQRIISFLIVVFGSITVNCWIINDIDFSYLQGQLGRDLEDLDDALDDFATQRISLIYPGTKWCGAGSIAEGYDDLGSERETDMCCRAHDSCADTISAGETKYNLTNDAFYTRLSCKCDEQFRKCLRATNKRTAKNIGTIYFNALGTKCFREDYPAEKCARRGGWLKQKCLEYTYDKTKSKRYQWFDVIDY